MSARLRAIFFFLDEAFLLQVDIMREIFGDALIRAPPDGTTLKIDTLPSPADLKGKILVKVTRSIYPLEPCN